MCYARRKTARVCTNAHLSVSTLVDQLLHSLQVGVAPCDVRLHTPQHVDGGLVHLHKNACSDPSALCLVLSHKQPFPINRTTKGPYQSSNQSYSVSLLALAAYPDEDAIVDLTETQQLQDFPSLWVHIINTTDANHKGHLGLRLNIEAALDLGLPL